MTDLPVGEGGICPRISPAFEEDGYPGLGRRPIKYSSPVHRGADVQGTNILYTHSIKRRRLRSKANSD